MPAPSSPAPSRSSNAATGTVLACLWGAAAVGLGEGVRLGSVGLALTLAPVFAVTGALIGAAMATAQRAAARTVGWRGRLIAAAPILLVAAPVGATLFDGARAQSLPLAGALPVLAPLAAYLAAIAAGEVVARLGGGPTRRAALWLVAAAALIVVNHRVARLGYPAAHLGLTVIELALVGAAVAARARRGPSRRALAITLAITLGTAAAAAGLGLQRSADRQALATVADEGRHLVRMWRWVLDLDRDGSSALLGGGDCDDLDARRHPGAVDLPGDGVDQDCDGHDADPPPPPPPSRAAELAAWRGSADVRVALERTAGMNVLVISVDALRADLLDPGAPGRDDFPRLGRLLDESVWFTRAIAPASATDVSLSTLLTGRADPYQPVATTLLEALRDGGRRTTAVIPVEVLRYVGEVLIGRGVDRLVRIVTGWENDDVGDHVSASATTQAALAAFAEAGGRPWVVWAHYFDVHEHHQIDVPAPLIARLHHRGASPVIERYRALLRAIDDEVGRVLDGLAARHQGDRTIVVFLSDHGEALGDDPRLPETHGMVAYGGLVRVPIAIRIPGVAPGQRLDAATLADVAPTVLALLGAPAAIAPCDGVDLTPALLDAPLTVRQPRRALIVHEESQWAVVDWPYQLLVRPADDLVELYDLERDPGERTDLAPGDPARVRALRARYAEAPEVKVDRTAAGRQWREQRAQPPPRRAPAAAAGATSTP